MRFQVRIDQYYEFFTPLEKKIADYIMQNSKKTISMSIHELAAAVQVAPSSITRFTRRLQYKSFSEMRIDLVRLVDSASLDDFSQLVSWSSTTEGISHHFINSIATICQETLDLNPIDKFKEAANLVSNANIVFLFGVGTSSIIAQDMEHKLMKVRKRCIFNIDGNYGLQNATMTTKHDVVIAVSFGGITKEVNLAVREAKSNNCKVIAFTRYARTTLSAAADINLYIPNVEQVTKAASIFPRYSALFIVDTLFLHLVQAMDGDPAQTLSDYRSLLKLLKESDTEEE